jgi:hypothetical protein
MTIPSHGFEQASPKNHFEFRIAEENCYRISVDELGKNLAGRTELNPDEEQSHHSFSIRLTHR